MSFAYIRNAIFACSLMFAVAGAAQTYPDKPIRVVTGGIGGGADFTLRLIAPGISGLLGQQVIVDNRPSGVIPGQIVSQAAPDGYTLLLYGNTFWIGPYMQETPYDVLKDFLPISLTNTAPLVLVVHPALPARSVGELIALAKAKPGTLNFASVGEGGSGHLAGELFKTMAGIDIVRINYKGSADALNALIGGQVQIMFPIAAEAAPHIKSGRLRALAVASASPSMLAPGLPTVAASLPGYVSGTEHGFFAPANTPAAIVNLLHRETVRFLNRAEVKEKLFNLGLDLVASSPDELAASMKSDMARMGKVLKDAGIAAEQTQ